MGVLLLLALAGDAVAAPPAGFQPPAQVFWRSRSKVYQQVQNERSIPVSVTRADLDSSASLPHQLRLLGGAWVKASPQATMAVVTDYDRLQELSDIIQEAKWSPAEGTLKLHCTALGYHLHMTLRLFPSTGEQESDVGFEVVNGHFVGMKGILRAVRKKMGVSELEFAAHYDHADLPLPRVFMSFGLEVILQKLAGRVRVEAERRFMEKPHAL